MNEQPHEILLNIVEYLPIEDIHNFCLTNKQFSQICNDDYYWKVRTLRDFRLPNEYCDNIINDPERNLINAIEANDHILTQIGLIYVKNFRNINVSPIEHLHVQLLEIIEAGSNIKFNSHNSLSHIIN